MLDASSQHQRSGMCLRTGTHQTLCSSGGISEQSAAEHGDGINSRRIQAHASNMCDAHASAPELARDGASNLVDAHPGVTSSDAQVPQRCCIRQTVCLTCTLIVQKAKQ